MSGRRRSSPGLRRTCGSSSPKKPRGSWSSTASRTSRWRSGRPPSGSACERGAGALPSNAQIQERLVERQRIFEPDTHDQRLAKLRLDCDERHGRARRLPAEARRRRARRHGHAELADRAARLQRFAGGRGRRARGAGLPPARQSAALSLRPRADGADSGIRAHGRRRGAAGHGVPRAGPAPLAVEPVDGKPMRRASRSAVLALLEPGAP